MENKSMNQKVSATGQTNYVWVNYEELVGTGGDKNLQVVEWPNGEGVTIVRHDDTNIDLTWCEMDAIILAIKTLRKM
jgi:hypothetical protein